MGFCKIQTMRDVLLFILVFALIVDMYFSSDVSTKKQYRRQYDTNEYNDYQDTKSKSLVNEPCYTTHMECVKKLDEAVPTPICVYQKKSGLVNYFSLCEINLQTCLQESTSSYGSVAQEDEIYYNGKLFPCIFYTRKSQNLAGAIRLYYMIGEKNTKYAATMHSLTQNEE